MTQYKYIVLSSLLFVACAQVQPQPQPEAVHTDNFHEQQPESTVDLPNVELSEELLYEFLLTEIANQRGYTAVAVGGSSDMAKKTRDPRLAKRAAQLAVESGQMDKAVDAIRFWQEFEPTSPMAMRMLSSILLRGGKIDAARGEFFKVLKADDTNIGYTFLQIFQMLASYPDKPEALRLMRDLAHDFPLVSEAHWAVAQLSLAAGGQELALSEARLARSLRPEWALAVSLEALLLQKDQPQQGMQLLRSYLADFPDAAEIRSQYARALLDQKQYKSARDEFQVLSDADPDNADLMFSIALISLQLNDFDGAEQQLKLALLKGKKEKETVQYYLAQLSEAKNKPEEAIAYYREVNAGDYQFQAQLRIAYLLAKRSQFVEAHQQLSQARAANNQQRAQLVMVDAQLFREEHQYAAAYEVLQLGLSKLPNNPGLLYETAMMADKVGKSDVFEQLIRKLIQINPDNAYAYNALGYSMLDRNERIPEAVELVEKALQLAPDDAAIMDSVGWGYYRTGKLEESVRLLQRALTSNPDPEIAAHLGEVLWVRGDKDAAKIVWQDSLKDHPGNVFLQAVMQKFLP